MKYGVQVDDLGEILIEVEEDQARATTSAMVQTEAGLKADIRRATEAAGLGRRLAYTWQGSVYPKRGTSTEASVWVFSKAPKLIGVFSEGAEIRSRTGGWLAIPTKNVPASLSRRAGSQFVKGMRKPDPAEVEAMFNQDLIRLPIGNGNFGLFIDAVAGRNGRGVRPATRGRLAQGRTRKLVLMFVLTPVVRIAKRLDIDALADKWATTAAGLIVSNWR